MARGAHLDRARLRRAARLGGVSEREPDRGPAARASAVPGPSGQSRIGGSVKPRFNYAKVARGVYDSMDVVDQYVAKCGWKSRCCIWCGCGRRRSTAAPIASTCTGRTCARWARASSGCMRSTRGEAPFYSAREQAALAWAEAVTLVVTSRISDAVLAEVRPHFNDKELADLTLAVATINTWNRLSIAARFEPGHYQPAQRG